MFSNLVELRVDAGLIAIHGEVKVHLEKLLLSVYLGVCGAFVGCSSCCVEGVLSS